VLDATELDAVREVATSNDLLVVTDEVYEHLVYPPSRHVPLATLPGMAERTLAISSAGKTFSFTGWKIGWATGPADLVAAVEGAKNWLSFASGAPLQPAIAVALDEHDAFHEGLAADLDAKRARLCAALARLDLDVFSPQGTYFVMTDVRRMGAPDGRELCLRLAERVGVVAIPAQVFYDDADEGRHLVRWAFCKDDAVLDEAISRLSRLEEQPDLLR
jgi:N-succinyldiaminopimelate aminotransferase